MQPLTERFGNPLATARTVLRRIARIDVCYMTTGACCLVHRDPHKLTPGDISNRLRQAMVLHHVGNLERFKSQYAMGIDQATRSLVAEVTAAIGNPLVDMGYHLAALPTSWSALRSFHQTALRLGQRLFIRPKETRIGNRFACTQCGKVAQSHVHSNGT